MPRTPRNDPESPDPGAIEAFFDSRAARYAGDFFDTSPMPRVYPLGLRRLEAALALIEREFPAGGRLVDLGCGGGQMVLAAVKAGFDALGIDRSEGMIAEAEARRSALPAETRERSAFRKGDLFGNGLGESSADVLTALGVLEYLPEDSAFLAEAARLVRPGGLMVLEVRNRLFNMTTANRFTVAEIEAGAWSGLLEQLAPLIRAPLAATARREFARRLKAVAERIDDALARDEARAEPSAIPPSFGDSRRQHAIGDLTARAEAAGFEPVSTRALHPHALPPALEAAAPYFYNQLAWLFDALAAEPAALAWSSAMLVAYRRRR